MDIRHHYLGWDKPFTIDFAEVLLAEGEGVREFDEWLIWVPSARAGRHILNELFTGDTTGNEAFHPPRLVTPAQFIQSLPSSSAEATESQRLLAWKTVLNTCHPRSVESVFPVIPTENRQQWAYTIARQLMSLKSRLAEEGWDFQRIAASGLENEQARWTDLSTLEAAYLKTLEAEGLVDSDTCFAEKLSRSIEGFLYKRVLVAGVMNLSQRQIRCLEALLAAGIPVDFYLPVVESHAATFDQWGRPRAGTWDKEAIPESLLGGKIQRAGEPRELVSSVLELAEVYHEQVDALVLGAPDSEIGEYAVERSRLSGTPFYAPVGKSLGATSWGRLIELVRTLQGSGTLQNILELLRHSLFRNWARHEGAKVDVVERALLRLIKDRLIRDIHRLRDSAFGPSKSIGIVREFMEMLKPVFLVRNPDDSFPEWLWGVLQAVGTGAELSDEGRGVLGQLEEILQDLNAEFDPAAVDDSDYWEILFYQLESNKYYPEREAAQRPVSGWLELPWERAPHLVILGLPDSEVPGSDGMDAFLTPGLCRQLDLYGPEQLTAFHGYRLRLILENRCQWGKVDILLPDRNLKDDPMRASRFLFLADESDILHRVELLLGERPTPEHSIPSKFGAVLKLPEPDVLTKIGVTQFSSYLRNPFRHYLERVLRWEPPQALPMEMNPMSFGTLAHKVLEELNKSEEGAGLISSADIGAFLQDHLSAEVGLKFGSQLSVPVTIQVGVMRERLKAAASVISLERQAGWLPVEVEWDIHAKSELLIAGIPLHGRIDLLERNEETGAYRVVDYKTSDKGDVPQKVHLSKVIASSADPVLPACDFEDGKNVSRWKDLQLPLYQLAVQKMSDQPVECAYLCLAKAVKDVCMARWTPTEQQSAAALACAEAVVDNIQKGYFPIPERSQYEDPWLPWLGVDYKTGIDPEWLTKHTEVSS